MDDDDDMAEMYLTDKLMQQHLDGSSVSSFNDRDGIDDSVLQSNVDAKRYLLSIFGGLDSANSPTTCSTYFYCQSHSTHTHRQNLKPLPGGFSSL